MKVIQLLPTISYGDAVGNDTLAIRDILRGMGYETAIYAENIDPRLPAGTATYFDRFPTLSNDDIIIYHGSTGTDLNYQLPELGGRKMMIYHNITPPTFFRHYAHDAVVRTEDGLAGIAQLRDKLEYCIAVSEFNKQDLLRMGYACPIDVCPILIPFSDYEKTPSREVMRKYEDDGYTNIAFVGRIAPNKKQEDIIRAFYAYHKYFNEKSRLVLVGDWSGMEKYHNRLEDYTTRLGLEEDVIFTGHIKFNEILAWYRLADVFLCMSEHEGFCVPLVEAMYFDAPIVAYNACAVPDTLGGSGVLLNSKDPKTVAEAIHKLISDETYREEVLRGQRERLKAFQYDAVRQRLEKQLNGFISGRPKRRPRIIQLTTTMSRGDAVCNDIRAFQRTFIKEGHPAPVYVEIMPKDNDEMLQDLSQLPRLAKDDIAIYHHATGTGLSKQFADLSCKKVLVYHNVTPPAFFAPYDENAAKSCRWGLDNLAYMSRKVDRCIAVSEFNKHDLEQAGFTCPIDICPILVPFDDYEQEPDQNTLDTYWDGRTNMVFVGRVAPNKRFEDVISAFAEYKRLDADARLILVGSYNENDKYYQFLKEHVRKLGVEDVIFTGHIRFSEILAWYRLADVFLCMSEHEGFCVPLIEAMYFDVPIVAYAACAVPDTLGGAGVLLDSKDPKTAAEVLWKLVSDGRYREEVLRCQRERLKYFSYENISNMLKQQISGIMNGETVT